MFRPMFNQILVEIDDKTSKWGSGGNDRLGGPSYREGWLREVGPFVPTADHPGYDPTKLGLKAFINDRVMWNEGHEAGKVFEEDGKKYGLVSWWDLVGAVVEPRDDVGTES